MKKLIDLSKFGPTLGPRVLGKNLFKEVCAFLEEAEENTVEIDLSSISSLSSGFSFEFFGGLYSRYQVTFNKRIKIRFAESGDNLKLIIKEAIVQYDRIRS